jgi:hypothetical protein
MQASYGKHFNIERVDQNKPNNLFMMVYLDILM